MMAYPARHVKVGDALGCAGAVAKVKVRCSCTWSSDEDIALDEPLKRQLAEMSCGSCGRLGQMRLVGQIGSVR